MRWFIISDRNRFDLHSSSSRDIFPLLNLCHKAISLPISFFILLANTILSTLKLFKPT
ncbi:hypothetical protein MBAV_003424 [Candidatus Magnetobacterium bavaricum]|uniref:Uncharacterized protein n=1 Tax=Candidatus Magnetobacterium bavaricum TaxID=29290 RepID=A0A0F3GRJ1_9BACT|nr:hypothetical protein MBAV_003424 [Candidatus Magnetobacterium bavaricum]